MTELSDAILALIETYNRRKDKRLHFVWQSRERGGKTCCGLVEGRITVDKTRVTCQDCIDEWV